MNRQDLSQSANTGPRIYYGYIVVAVSLIITIAHYSQRSSFGVFFKPVLTEFGWTRALTSGAYSTAWIIEGILGIFMGWLNDKIGPRIVLTISGILIGLGCVLMSRIETIWQLYLFYGVIIGIGLSGTFVPILTLASRWFFKRRSTMNGLILTGTGLGTLIAPPLATWIISIYDWRTSYIVMGIVVMVIMVTAAQFLKRDPSQIGQWPYGYSTEGELKPSFLLEGFSLKEAACTRQFWMVFIMASCLGCCQFAIIVHLVPHATDMGISPASAANILAALGGLTIIGRLLLGSAADRIGNRLVLVIGFFLMAATLLWLTRATDIWMLYLFAIIYGIAEGGMGAVVSPLVAQIFGLKSLGTVFGAISFGVTIGCAVGPSLTGYIFDITGSYNTAFLVLAAIAIAGLLLIGLLKPIRDEQGKSTRI